MSLSGGGEDPAVRQFVQQSPREGFRNEASRSRVRVIGNLVTS